jgi:hypothetical protein
MTGYLYRKALSVLQPGTSIHPIVRPMFSESGQQQPVDASLFTREATGYASPGCGTGTGGTDVVGVRPGRG